ncbi:MAG TPA: hypothetical protein VIT45_08800, partial [Allosphingosinicella sp.]
MQAANALPGAGPPPPEVRAGIRDLLTSAPNYADVDREDRKAIAHSLVRIAHAASLLAEETKDEAGRPLPPSHLARPAVARAMNAGDQYSGTSVRQLAAATEATLKAISFPRFVNELITGVFKAILEANQQQLDQYLELIRGVSASLDGFTEVNGSDVAARRWLVEQFPQSYAIEEPEADDGMGMGSDPSDDPPEPPRIRSVGSAPSEAALRTVFGLGPEDELPSGGGEAMVPFAKRAMARNRQQMLASMITMGMQRIVIDGGRISAGMRFHIDARSAAREDTGSQFDTRTEIGASASGGFGPFSASASLKQNIGFVSTRDVSTSEELNASADLTSNVELQFRTDQVPLDRLAAASTVERLRLNTVNPTRELEIAAQEDQARATARATQDQAWATRQRAGAAPSATVTVPPVPPI